MEWRSFNANGGLFLREAFVSGGAKPKVDGNPHAADAMMAADAFVDALSDATSTNAIEEAEVRSLVGMSLLRTGWTDEVGGLKAPCPDIKPAAQR